MMAALVQSYPQQSSTVTMLQTRPSSASGILQSSSQAPSHHQYPINPSQRNSFHGIPNGIGASSYRGHTSVTPIAPYAFTSTPSLAMPGQRVQGGPHLRSEQRTSSAPIIPTFDSGNTSNRSRYPAAASISTTSSSSSSDLSSLSQKSGSRDDSTISGIARVGNGNPRPQSTIFSASQSLAPPTVSTTKASPDRYRRPNNRRAESSTGGPQTTSQVPSIGSAMPNVMQFYGNSTQQVTPPVNLDQGFNVQLPQISRQPLDFNPTLSTTADDMQLNRQVTQDQAKRYRRRSIHTINAAEYAHDGAKSISAGLQQQGSRQVSSANGRIDHQQHPLRSSPIVTVRPASSHGRNGSSESVNSTRSSSHHSRPNSVSLSQISSIPHRSGKSFTMHYDNLSLAQLNLVNVANALILISGHQARGIQLGKCNCNFEPRPTFVFSNCQFFRRRADFAQK